MRRSSSRSLHLLLRLQWSVAARCVRALATHSATKHSVKRVRQSAEAVAARKKKEEALLAEYLALEKDVLERVRSPPCQSSVPLTPAGCT